MKNLLIEGWRGMNHSFAMVNQCQILELLKFDDLQLFHRDLPYAMPHWNAKNLDAGFGAADRQRIAALPDPGQRRMDCVYRVTSPFRADAASRNRTVTFMVTELGISARNFETGGADIDFYTRDDNCIVTPTHWSRARLLEFGFPADRVHVVAHGVRSDTYRPLTANERAATRANLGVRADEVVFLNLGAALWNKGADVLLLAFARLCQTQPKTKLILKDQRGLYGISVEQTIKDLSAQHPALFGAATLAAMQVVPGNLSQGQLRLMYGMADVYVSAYRAEGFNLPVLEAIACGTPAVVTDGGATDDFCDASVAVRVASRPGTRRTHGDAAQGSVGPCIGHYREPDPDALLQAMQAFCTGPGIDRSAFEIGRRRLVERLSWRYAAQTLHGLLVTQPALAEV